VPAADGANQLVQALPGIIDTVAPILDGVGNLPLMLEAIPLELLDLPLQIATLLLERGGDSGVGDGA